MFLSRKLPAHFENGYLFIRGAVFHCQNLEYEIRATDDTKLQDLLSQCVSVEDTTEDDIKAFIMRVLTSEAPCFTVQWLKDQVRIGVGYMEADVISRMCRYGILDMYILNDKNKSEAFYCRRVHERMTSQVITNVVGFLVEQDPENIITILNAWQVNALKWARVAPARDEYVMREVLTFLQFFM